MTDSKRSDPTQSDQKIRFMEAARALGADEDEAAFKAKLATIAKQTPKDEPQAASSKGKKNG